MVSLRYSIVAINTLITFMLLGFSAHVRGLEVSPTDEGSTDLNKKITVTFVCPCKDVGNPYWNRYLSFMNETALSLNISLKVVHAGEFRRPHITSVLREINSKPDYLVTRFIRRAGYKILEESHRTKVPLMLVNVEITEEDQKHTGQPREKYPYWIGKLAPNDFQAGYNLGKMMIKKAEVNGMYATDGRIHLVAIVGDTDASFVRYRLEGLRAAIEENKKAWLRQILVVDWQDNILDKKVKMLFERFPEVSTFWNVTSELAQSAISAIELTGRRSGEDILVGGVDWTEESIKSLSSGKQNISMGGHFMEGGRALAMLYDYHNGNDFATNSAYFSTDLDILSNENVEKYRAVLEQSNWQYINFKQLTKTHNHSLKHYDFTIENINNYFSPNERHTN